jgi:hypothetical protein
MCAPSFLLSLSPDNCFLALSSWWSCQPFPGPPPLPFLCTELCGIVYRKLPPTFSSQLSISFINLSPLQPLIFCFLIYDWAVLKELWSSKRSYSCMQGPLQPLPPWLPWFLLPMIQLPQTMPAADNLGCISKPDSWAGVWLSGRVLA